MPIEAAAPRSVRLAGLLVGLQGLAGVAFAVAVVVKAIGAPAQRGALLGEAGYFVLLGGGVLFAGICLVLGKRGARTPAIVMQLLLLAVAYYAYSSHQRLAGLLVAAFCVTVLVLLFTAPARAWVLRVGETHDGDAQG
ncbi:hypothetical protein F0L68_19450 [Solihabitans fulvus]|uniref:Uncharacterized protein n=1 Tax=Solihabitans fulvus TaxID=1892852 RepID=A0A5B2XCG3_9PSEU|nr:hypothetical protein [Solihabitans fulvus]KAA2260973.1 hypothetical protein F0L68_19450 [Solihabitans fulvus]